MNKILKIVSVFVLLLSFTVSVFALEANISVDKNTVMLGESFSLELEIISSDSGEINVEGISGIENFDIISQSQSQSSSTSVVIINGQTKSKLQTKHILKLILKAKSDGNYTIGPAIIKQDNKEFKTNSINITVGTTNNNPASNKTATINKATNSLQKQEEKQVMPEKKSFLKDDYSLYLLVGILSFLGILFYVLLNKDSNFGVSKEAFKPKEEEKQKSEKLDFEDKKILINYPDISDKDFIEKIEKVFRQKIAQKYSIANIETKTLEEIQNLLPENKQIEKIIYLINKSKYSNIIGDNSKILELVQKF